MSISWSFGSIWSHHMVTQTLLVKSTETNYDRLPSVHLQLVQPAVHGISICHCTPLFSQREGRVIDLRRGLRGRWVPFSLWDSQMKRIGLSGHLYHDDVLWLQSIGFMSENSCLGLLVVFYQSNRQNYLRWKKDDLCAIFLVFWSLWFCVYVWVLFLQTKIRCYFSLNKTDQEKKKVLLDG